LTERASEKAIIPRHSRTKAPIAPRMPPTMMKTLPSGRLDFCIKGALAVLGTVGVGSVAPATDGRLDRWKMSAVLMEVVEELMEMPLVRETSTPVMVEAAEVV
jgi:hypothetical protein